MNATRITSIAAGQDDSDVVEIRARIYPTQSIEFKCDVLVNGKIKYFNYISIEKNCRLNCKGLILR